MQRRFAKKSNQISRQESFSRPKSNEVEKAAPAHPLLHLQRAVGNRAGISLLTSLEGRQPTVPQVMMRAAGESSRPLEGSLQRSLQDSLGHDFSQARVHSGPASEEAATRLQARAYTLGNDIHLGPEARHISSTEKERLLAHEAVHTLQQGGKTVQPSSNLAVSQPNDASEIEAQRIADSVVSNQPSPSLALRDRMRSAPSSEATVSRLASPQIQRDLTGTHTVKDGTFTLDLKTQSNPGAKSGMKGTIKFLPSAAGPDSSSIRLLQIVRLEDLSTGSDYVWTGGEADRNKMQTAEDKAKGIKPGFFVDHLAAAASPRTKKADPAVSPYYRDYWPNPKISQDGSKKGKAVTEASLYDYPGWSKKSRFAFETAAKSPTHGYVYASLHWGFTISDGAKGKIENEHAKAEQAPSKTFGAAAKAFNEFYKNPGASTAPK